MVIGIIRVVHDNVVPLHAEVVTNAVGVGGAELLVTWNVSELVGYTGIDGVNPPLQAGGVQAAVIAAFPAVEAAMVPTLPKTELDPPVTATECGEEETQVKGTSVSVIPRVSFTFAFTVMPFNIFVPFILIMLSILPPIRRGSFRSFSFIDCSFNSVSISLISRICDCKNIY